MQRETSAYVVDSVSFGISILSLYAEGDDRRTKAGKEVWSISILSLYAEGDNVFSPTSAPLT